jgi:hypothetical protein
LSLEIKQKPGQEENIIEKSEEIEKDLIQIGAV